MKLKGKKVLITGATSGLGFSLAKLLVKKGCRVYGTGSSKANVNKAVGKLKSANFRCLVSDVSDPQEVEILAKKAGAVEVLINNAGIWLSGKLEANSVEDITRVLDVNLKGVILTTRAFLAGMSAKKEAIIFNITSTAGIEGKSGLPVYAASKWGVTGFTKVLQTDLAQTGVKVIGFYPGGMNTRLFEKAGDKKEISKWMDTDKVAEIIVSILEQDKSMVTDQVVLKKRV